MSFQVFNTLTRKKEPFQSAEPGIVKMYACGPTVYNRPSIGNYRTFLFADLLARWLRHLGNEVRFVSNITDVGHLLGDADDGEDRIQRQAEREKRDPYEISRHYAELYLQDMADLGAHPHTADPRATDHIDDMLAMIQGLVDKGHAYVAGENVYFDVSTFPAYGALSGNRLEDLEAGARVAVRDEKRRPEDFALWKSDPRHLMKWKSQFGDHGFPGWHIECSAMARSLLGDEIDIHAGGEDLAFPHHECEIAQSECFTGKRFARYWMHCRFLQIDGGKMSKSLGNVYGLDDVRERGHDMRTLRFALIRGHYREPLNFTWEVMDQSRAALESLDDLVRRLRRLAERDAVAEGDVRLAEVRAKFEGAMNDDLHVPTAVAALFELRDHALRERLGGADASAALAWLAEVDGVLGVLDLEEDQVDDEIQALIDQRLEARKSKDFAEADRIRDELAGRGVVLEDTPEGTLWRRG